MNILGTWIKPVGDISYAALSGDAPTDQEQRFETYRHNSDEIDLLQFADWLRTANGF